MSSKVLRFVADPADVFNKQFKRAALLSRDLSCGAMPTVIYDETTGSVAVEYDIYSFASAFDPAQSLKGCCTQGTLYTKIGSPETAAVEISTTWGQSPTVTFTSNSVSYTRSFGLSPVMMSTTSSAIVDVVFVFSGDALSSAEKLSAVSQAKIKMNLLTAGTSSLLLCSDTSDSSKCATVISISLPTTEGCTVHLSGPLTPTSLYLVDVSSITAADLATVKYSYQSFVSSTDDKMDGFKSVTTASGDTSYFSFPGKIENLLDNGGPSNFLSTCLIDPTSYGYNPKFDTAYFAFRYNIRSVVTAVAVNNEQLPISALQETYTNLSLMGPCLEAGLEFLGVEGKGGVCMLAFNGDMYTIRTYIDPKYDSMRPIFCLERTTSAHRSYTFSTLCLLRVDGSYVYPFLNHLGTTSSTFGPTDDGFYDPGQQCACDDSSYDPNFLYTGTFGSNSFAYKITNSRHNTYCNLMDLMHGFVIMSEHLNSPGYSGSTVRLSTSSGSPAKAIRYKLLRYLQMANGNTAADIAKYAYIAGFATLRISYGLQIFDNPFSVTGWKELTSNIAGGTGATPMQFCNGYSFAMNAATDGTAAVLAYSGTGGESSATLTVVSSTVSAVLQDGMSITWLGSSGIVTLSGCSISVLTSAGTCTMSSAQTIGSAAAPATVTGTLSAVFLATTNGGETSTTLIILRVNGPVYDGGVITTATSGVTSTVTLSGCKISQGAGTCTLSSPQSIDARTTITITNTAIFTASATTQRRLQPSPPGGGSGGGSGGSTTTPPPTALPTSATTASPIDTTPPPTALPTSATTASPIDTTPPPTSATPTSQSAPVSGSPGGGSGGGPGGSTTTPPPTALPTSALPTSATTTTPPLTALPTSATTASPSSGSSEDSVSVQLVVVVSGVSLSSLSTGEQTSMKTALATALNVATSSVTSFVLSEVSSSLAAASSATMDELRGRQLSGGVVVTAVVAVTTASTITGQAATLATTYTDALKASGGSLTSAVAAAPQLNTMTYTLTITSVTSGTISDGLTLVGAGISGAVTLSHCMTSGPLPWTCTMSSPQFFASEIITGSSATPVLATGGTLSTKLTVTSVLSGVVTNGMAIRLVKDSNFASPLTLSACSFSVSTGICTLSSAQSLAPANFVGAPLDLAGNAYGSPDCTIYAMNTYDPTASVNTNQLNLLRSHCFDEFSMPNSSWERDTKWRYDTDEVPSEYNEKAGLGAFFVPPMHLVQSYYICYNKLTTSLSIAFGSAAGTAGIATGVAVTLMITLVTAGWFKSPVPGGDTDQKIAKGGAVLAGTGAAAWGR